MGKRKKRTVKSNPSDNLKIAINPEKYLKKSPKFVGEVNTSFRVGVIYKGRNEQLKQDVFDLQFLNPDNGTVCLLQNLLESSVKDVAKSLEGFIAFIVFAFFGGFLSFLIVMVLCSRKERMKVMIVSTSFLMVGTVIAILYGVGYGYYHHYGFPHQ